MGGSLLYRVGEAAIGIAGLALSGYTGGLSALAATAAIAGIEVGRQLYDTANAPDSVQTQQSLADIKLQTSTLGAILPQIFGDFGGLAGNIFWATDKIEHEHRETTSQQGGKGG